MNKKNSCLLLSLLLLLAGGCGSREFNFSQVKGFDEIRASLASTPPTPAQQRLLQRYRPLLYVAANAEGPLDFYSDYIASGVLTVEGEVYENPTAQQLNSHKNNPAAVFTHQAGRTAVTPVAYGGIHKDSIDLPGIGSRDLTFLSYHFAFRSSGLPAGISPFTHTIANLVADSEDWHQLDHYTAVYVVLADNQPRAVMLQQHNYMRTYFIGSKHFPAGETLKIDAAISSNELYPHSAGRRVWRSVGFLAPDTVGYLLELEEEGSLYSGNDITEGKRQVAYQLQFLPPDDAFYVFEGWLGERRWLPGRDGPPGAIYRNLPQIWQLNLSLPVFYWNEGDEEYAAIWQAKSEGWQLSEQALMKLKQRFARAWAAHFPANT